LQVFYRAGHVIPFSVPQPFADVVVEFLEYGTAPPVKLAKWAAQLQ